MSRRRKKSSNPTASDVVVAETAGDDSNEDTSRVFPLSRQALISVFAVAGCWWAFLAATAALTANPATFNRVQIRQANIIVEAIVTRADDGAVIVDRVIQGEMPDRKLTIRNLAETGVRNGRGYIIPLTLDDDDYVVTQPRFVGGHPPKMSVRFGPPLVYRRTDESVARLKSLLNELETR